MKLDAAALAALMLVLGCRTAAPQTPAPAARAPQAPRHPRPVSQPGRVVRPIAAEDAPLAPPPRSLRWVQRSAEYRALFLQTYRAATEHVERAAEQRAAGTWGIVTDADETALSNVQYEVELMRTGEETASTDPRFDEWVARRAATPLPGAAEFLRRVRALGGRIAIITNRPPAACPATEDVLKKWALPYDVLLCGSGDKNPRFESVRSGAAFGGGGPVEVVAYLGDNIRDFPQAGQELRKKDDAAFAEFGGRFFAFPNPLYGSWLGNPD